MKAWRARAQCAGRLDWGRTASNRSATGSSPSPSRCWSSASPFRPTRGNHLLRSFTDEWPAYAVSFSTIGAVWLGLSAITEYLDRSGPLIIRLNLLLLMVVSFLPFPTRLLATYIDQTGPERVASTI
jgi:hypothetical protein